MSRLQLQYILRNQELRIYIRFVLDVQNNQKDTVWQIAKDIYVTKKKYFTNVFIADWMMHKVQTGVCSGSKL